MKENLGKKEYFLIGSWWKDPELHFQQAALVSGGVARDAARLNMKCIPETP